MLFAKVTRVGATGFVVWTFMGDGLSAMSNILGENKKVMTSLVVFLVDQHHWLLEMWHFKCKTQGNSAHVSWAGRERAGKDVLGPQLFCLSSTFPSVWCFCELCDMHCLIINPELPMAKALPYPGSHSANWDFHLHTHTVWPSTMQHLLHVHVELHLGKKKGFRRIKTDINIL